MAKLSAEGRLRLAVKMACVAGAGVAAAPVHAEEGAGAGSSATTLEKVEVTGTRIKRVDVETANPVYTLDRQAIERTGVQTLGQLIQRAPAMVGDATTTNPQVNNGGGTGDTNVSLRGLGVPRTLILLDGHRMVTQDVNAVPINVVERVEILKEGASAIYGSDAIAGVVNIITQKDKRDGDFIADLGMSSKHDGRRRDFSVAYGLSGDKGHATIGLTYNEQDLISAGAREFSGTALYLYSGQVQAAGSSRNPQGRMFLPADATAPGTGQTFGEFYGCNVSGGNISVARKPGAEGTALGDYTCYSGAQFAFNYQAVGNVIVTPQQRYGMFASASYDINSYVTLFTEFFHNTTKSNSQIAPLPFDAQADNTTVPTDNPFNIFGVEFGPNGNEMLTRFVSGGNRFFGWQVLTDQINLGLKGGLFDTGWHWEAHVGYGRIDRKQNEKGYLDSAKLEAALAADCGSNCLNLFNLDTATDVFNSLLVGAENSTVRQLTTTDFNVSGDLFPMAGGNASLAAGVNTREEVLRGEVDSKAQLNPLTFPNLTCGLSQEACTTAADGHIQGTDVYAEFFFPILANVTAVKSLNVSLGDRFSTYKNFGHNNTVTVALEYRPIGDLLIRSNFATVYRIPNIEDQFLPQKVSNPTFRDPCTFIDEPVGTDPNHDLACQGVPRDGTFRQATSQITSVVQGNPNLVSEKGNVVTFGFVYDSSLLPGFSSTVDFWHYKLNNYLFDVGDVATGLDPNISASVCFQTGDPRLCSLLHRAPDGNLSGTGFVDAPAFNLGTLTSQGVDAGVKYRTKRFDFGRFTAGVDVTYQHKFTVAPEPGAADIEVASTFIRQFGTYPKWHGIGTVGWEGFGADFLLTERWIGSYHIDDADAVIPGINVHYSDTFYTNLELGYTFAPTKTRLALGIDNVTDATPKIMFQNNVINANTDVQTFDTVGRYYWLRLTQRF
ncbi:MAG TPA: TonB-dependent receptor plug domain-containing protein [Nevskiaceae bacterium]|nr:TonB-dependent receptor plug domain-containing protein [Nevskiaceae bacterium]